MLNSYSLAEDAQQTLRACTFTALCTQALGLLLQQPLSTWPICRHQELCHHMAELGRLEFVHMLQQQPASTRELMVLQGLEHQHHSMVTLGLVCQKEQNLWMLEHRPGNPNLVLQGCRAEHCANHTTARGAQTDAAHVALDDADKAVALVFRAKLKQLLEGVVPNRVAGEGCGVSQQGLYEPSGLRCRALAQCVLNDSTRVPVLGSLHHQTLARGELVHNELQGLGPHHSDALLKDVVRVRAPHCLGHVSVQLFC
mmetsp:Transcript_62436/g.157999  ORF Transcript_62436/g.157999 Transcript_62436/m.157999 type:complete len:255 (-) Transcript_62436:471-1235(-)